MIELRDGGERFAGGRAGERLALPGGGRRELLAPYLTGARLWLAELDTGASALLDYLAEHGRPIRYGYVERELAAGGLPDGLRDCSRAAPRCRAPDEPFTHELVTALVARGIAIAPITLHTGVSSQEAGELPYPERYAVPPATARIVNAARGAGRVIAVGTTVVRALETVARDDGRIAPGAGWTQHVVTPSSAVRAVDGLLTGWHEPAATHLLMLEAVGGRALVEDSYREALRRGYLWHEFGDLHLIHPAGKTLLLTAP